jgi:hypothetical protein
MGKDALVSIQLKYLHPSEHIRRVFPNPQNRQRLEGCKVVELANRRINGKVQPAVVVVHDSIPGVQLYAVVRWFKVDQQGPPEGFFVSGSPPVVEEGELAEVPEEINCLNEAGIAPADIEDIRANFSIDDDNEPAPENVPDPFDFSSDNVFTEWHHDGTCYRRKSGAVSINAHLNHVLRVGSPTLLTIFEKLFPVHFVENTMIPEMNKVLDTPITYGEFLRFIGLWFLMSTTNCESRKDFFSRRLPTPFSAAPFILSDYMTGYRFESIINALKYTERTPPSYRDKFWEVRDIIQAWNDNMMENFTPSWVSCLDESMSKWLNQYTCPGYMVVPRKPWPFGNEYHSICCAKTGIMYAIELVEGKDVPAELPAKEFEHLGKTVSLLLRLTKSIWGSSRLVILDSGFCVLEGIVALRQKGVFASALIKKRKYWPKFIPGDEIVAHFQEAEVGSVGAYKGCLHGVDFHVHCMKEPDYVTQLMSTYGTLERVGKERSRLYVADGVSRRVSFSYPEVVHNHYTYRDAVDNHNACRMYPIALEETWKTTRWPTRVFQFLLAISEVNVRFAYTKLYDNGPLSQLQFRRLLAEKLIFNPYREDDGVRTPNSTPRAVRRRRTSCELLTLPPKKTFRHGRLATCKTTYIQLKCVGCPKKTRTYCSCSLGTPRCTQCFVTHCMMDTTPS